MSIAQQTWQEVQASPWLAAAVAIFVLGYVAAVVLFLKMLSEGSHV